MKINDPDWNDYKVEEIGANLEDLIGLPNTVETAKEGVRRITSCLIKDGLLDRNDLFIKPVPINKYTIAYFVYMNVGNGDPIGFELHFNLENGVVLRSA